MMPDVFPRRVLSSRPGRRLRRPSSALQRVNALRIGVCFASAMDGNARLTVEALDV